MEPCGNTPSEAVGVLGQVQHAGYSINVLEMWKNTGTHIFQNSSHPFWKVAATWPARSIPVQIRPPPDAFYGCPSSWCHLDARGLTTGLSRSNQSVVKLLEVKDVRHLVTHMEHVDFNLLIIRLPDARS